MSAQTVFEFLGVKLVEELAFDPGSWRSSPFPLPPDQLQFLSAEKVSWEHLLTHTGGRLNINWMPRCLEIVFFGGHQRDCSGGAGGGEEGLGKGVCARWLSLTLGWSRSALLCEQLREDGEGRGCWDSTCARVLLFSPFLA